MSRRPDRLARYHALSGILIALFASLHLLDVAAALGGPVAFSYLRGLLRHLYQQPVYEVLGLTVPLLFNLATGIAMLARRSFGPPSGASEPARLRRRLHRWSGVGLVALVWPHALSTRGAALAWNIDPDFNFVARTLAGPRGIAFGSLYGLLIAAISYHLANGMFTFLDDAGLFERRMTRRLAGAIFILIGSTLMLCGLLGLLAFAGVLYPTPSIETLPVD